MKVHVDLTLIKSWTAKDDDGVRTGVTLYECLCGAGRIGVRTSLGVAYADPEWVILCEYCARRWQVSPSIGLAGVVFVPTGAAVSSNAVRSNTVARAVSDDSSSEGSSSSGGSPDVPEKSVPPKKTDSSSGGVGVSHGDVEDDTSFDDENLDLDEEEQDLREERSHDVVSDDLEDLDEDESDVDDSYDDAPEVYEPSLDNDFPDDDDYAPDDVIEDYGEEEDEDDVQPDF